MLNIHRAERADALVAVLGDLLADPLDDPMMAEVIAVPTSGVERWLTQRLATRLGTTSGGFDGVCANVEFPFPGALIGRAVAAATGVDPKTDPWSPERVVWPLIDVVDASLDEPWLAPLSAHLRGAAPKDESRRFGSVRHVADLFDRYAVHRPAMLRSWAAGEDVGADGRTLDAGSAWQPALWRELRERVGTPSLAERLQQACARLHAEPDLVDLPPRVSLFGLTRLAPSYLQVLNAIAEGRDIHLFLLHPSPALWGRVAPMMPGPRRRADDTTAALVDNPLLASWGRDAREVQLVLAAANANAIDDHRPLGEVPDTLLGRIQADIRADRALPGMPLPGQPDGRADLAPDDRSVQVHACHGRARQVEVVRDAVLHLLEDDPTLEPRDVIVMCPDIEAYAPLIHATFGASQPDDDPDADALSGLPELRVRLADRSLRQTNPVLGVVATLLELAGSRVTASQVVDLAGREPVRRRFGFDDDDLSRLEQWVTGAGVRWGFDGDHRASFGLAGLETGTWNSGLDRTLLGVAMADADQRIVAGVVPLDDVDSGDIVLAGRYAEFVDRLEVALATFSEKRVVDAWADVIATAANALCATSDRDAWQRAQLQRLLDDVAGEATGADGSSAALLTLGEVGSLLGDRLRGRPTRANFRTGQLTICTLVPMRSVPHRVVCLLGLDDGVFPRAGERDGDDLILVDPCVGDRDARTEDRQLLLDALLAATQHLVITYTGRDERNNLVRPPSVPVGELLDVVDRTVRTKTNAPARAQVVVHHPLQPFDARNFVQGALVPEYPWSFDTVNLAGRRSAQPRDAVPPFLAGALTAPPGGVVEIAQLERFMRHPTKSFLRERLGIFLTDRIDELDDALPVELDALEKWAVGDRLLSARLAGGAADACVAAEQARGLLPPGGLGGPVLRTVAATVEEIVAAWAAAVGPGEPASLDAYVSLPDVLLSGVVPGVIGDVICSATFSKLGASHRLIAWLRVLALSAARPDRPFEALTIGKAVRGPGCAVARIRSVGAAAAEAHLTRLVDLFQRSMVEPIPLACKTSAAWAGGGARAAAGEWESTWNYPKEDADAEHRLVLGGTLSFAQLLEDAPRSDERGTGWDEDEPTRFGRYAHALWDGLLAHETVGKA